MDIKNRIMAQAVLKLIDSAWASGSSRINLSGKNITYTDVLEIINTKSDFCANLTLLNLSFNKIVFLPREFSIFKKLEELDLSHNKLSALPETTKELINLKKIYLDHNAIAVPEEVQALLPKCKMSFEGNQSSYFLHLINRDCHS